MYQTQAPPQPESPYSPPPIESRLHAIAEGHDQIVDHLMQLSQLRQQQKVEGDRTIAALKSEVAAMRSYIWLCTAGMVGTALLAATSSIFQTQQINLLQEQLNVRSHQSAVQTRKS
jgi:hypothetical protein